MVNPSSCYAAVKNVMFELTKDMIGSLGVIESGKITCLTKKEFSRKVHFRSLALAGGGLYRCSIDDNRRLEKSSHSYDFHASTHLILQSNVLVVRRARQVDFAFL